MNMDLTKKCKRITWENGEGKHGGGNGQQHSGTGRGSRHQKKIETKLVLLRKTGEVGREGAETHCIVISFLVLFDYLNQMHVLQC